MDAIMNTLINMQINGLLNRNMEADKVEIYTLGKEYKIVLNRKTSSLFGSEKSTSFICNMDIYDILNRHVFHISSNEVAMATFIDVLYWMIESNQDTAFNLDNYNIYLSNVGMNYKMDIKINNGAFLTPVLTLIFDYDSLDKFMNGMYFMYLIDIDDGNRTSMNYYEDNSRILIEGGIV